MSVKIYYPWEKTKPGEGFFVPTLDPKFVRWEGLQMALRAGVRGVDAHYAIKGGLMGVWFSRKPAVLSLRAESSAA